MYSSAFRSVLATILIVLAVILTLVGIFEVGASETDLHRLWDISYPNVTLIQENSTIIVDYGMSEILSGEENVRKNILANPDSCEGPDLTEGILLDTVDPITGAHVFQLNVSELVHNEEISTIDYDNDKGTMELCLFYSLWSGTEEDAIEINSVYNTLYIYLSMDRGIQLDGFLVKDSPDDDDTDGDRHKHLETEKHFLDVYLCDHATYERTSAPVGGYGMGDVLSICAEATQSIIDDGIYLKGVDNFLWKRTAYRGALAFVTEQWAVKDGVPDGVSSYWCPQYALFCTFTTMLNAEFFMSEGFVEGIGSAALSFGVRKLDPSAESLDDETPITIRTDNGSTTLPKAKLLRSLQEEPDEDDSNMSILIPIRGPGTRPKLRTQSSGDDLNTSKPLLSRGTYWVLISAFLSVMVLGGFLAWREWQLGNVGEKGRSSGKC